MSDELTAKVSLISGMEFSGAADSGHIVKMDAADEFGGKNIGSRPMELVLIGLGGCTGMDVISMLRKMKQDISGFEINLKGKRAEDHPKVYKEIEIEFVVKGKNLSETSVAKAIKLSEEKYCSVGNMLNKTAKITTSFKIVEI